MYSCSSHCNSLKWLLKSVVLLSLQVFQTLWLEQTDRRTQQEERTWRQKIKHKNKPQRRLLLQLGSQFWEDLRTNLSKRYSDSVNGVRGSGGGQCSHPQCVCSSVHRSTESCLSGSLSLMWFTETLKVTWSPSLTSQDCVLRSWKSYKIMEFSTFFQVMMQTEVMNVFNSQFPKFSKWLRISQNYFTHIYWSVEVFFLFRLSSMEGVTYSRQRSEAKQYFYFRQPFLTENWSFPSSLQSHQTSLTKTEWYIAEHGSCWSTAALIDWFISVIV